MAARKNEVVTELPKELVALRAAIREAIKLNDADTLEDRIEAAEKVAIGAIIGKPGNHKSEEIPERDSGKALVGHWCFLWDGGDHRDCDTFGLIDKVNEDESLPYHADGWGDYEHAHPVKLGFPA